MANQYTSYYLYQKYEKRGDQDWLPCYPNIFSVDGEGTMPLVIKTENDPECGYTPPTEPIYRWYNIPITTDYVCDTCPALQYRWVNKDISTFYECVGTDKYYVQKRQYSYDSGTTWNDVVPEETQRGSLYESNSVDCGYVPPIEPQYRTTSGTPYCTGYDLYVNVYSQVSYDEGSTWETTATTITLVQENSPQCGYVPPTPSYSAQYLTFVAEEAGTFKFSGSTTANTVQYSLDSGSTWNTLARNTDSPTVGAGNKIMWKGTLTTTSSANGVGYFSSSGRFEAEGNIMSLLYGDDFEDKTSIGNYYYSFTNLFSGCTGMASAENMILPATTLSTGCYYNMFAGCTSLTTAPELPATDLQYQCYSSMFANCSSLTSAPQLPATTLAGYYCYSYMFRGCTSLTTAPELTATTLSTGCYGGMFEDCTSLTTAPELPSTTLANGCYGSMFLGCTSLTTAPVLSATTLSTGCYGYMFAGCTSLTTAPELPATILVSSCYEGMFQNCTNLNYIKCLATDISASYCTTNWVYGVSSSTGTFVKNSSMSSWPRSNKGIPSGWTVQDA